MARRKLPYRCALVTGASRGLGRVFSAELAARGVKVLGTSRVPAGIDFPEGRLLALDLSNPGGVDTFFRENKEALSEVDLLINNAGEGVFGLVETRKELLVERQVRVLLEGPIELFEKLKGNLMLKQGGVVNVSSIGAEIPIPGFALYSSMKAGLSQFSRGLMLEGGGKGLQVVDLQCGDFRTTFNAYTDRGEGMSEGDKALWVQMEKYLEKGADPQKAGERLMGILADKKSGTYRVGGFFQTRLAPLGARILPSRLMRMAVRRYYGMS